MRTVTLAAALGLVLAVAPPLFPLAVVLMVIVASHRRAVETRKAHRRMIEERNERALISTIRSLT